MKELPERIFRLGRRDDPWDWPDWAYAQADGTFGNRFDDPRGVYRVLYAATERLATFVECLGCYRPDPIVFAQYDAIVSDDGDEEPPAQGEVPVAWLYQRCVGEGRLAGEFTDIGHHESLVELRSALAARVAHYGIHDLDAAAIRLSVPRAFTQEVSRYVFDRSVDGRRRWKGITYGSRFGDDLHNWALFEPDGPLEPTVDVFAPDDPDLAQALSIHGLTLA